MSAAGRSTRTTREQLMTWTSNLRDTINLDHVVFARQPGSRAMALARRGLAVLPNQVIMLDRFRPRGAGSPLRDVSRGRRRKGVADGPGSRSILPCSPGLTGPPAAEAHDAPGAHSRFDVASLRRPGVRADPGRAL